MSATINIQFTPQAEAVLKRLEELPRTVMVAIARAVDQQNGRTIDFIKQKHLSYGKGGPVIPDGLRVQDNRLRPSIRASKCVISGNSVTSGIGSNVKYARVHEFGFNGSVNVPQHERKIIVGTGVVTIGGRKKRIKIGGTATVRAHSRKMNLPARRFILRGIASNMDAYSVLVSDAIVKTAKGEGA